MKYFAMAALLICVAASAQNSTQTEGQDDSLRPVSPRLQSLAAALQKSDTAALENFWASVNTEHTPLRESVPGHADELLYTFLYRARDARDVANVRLTGTWPMPEGSRNLQRFVRLGKSDVWYISYSLPRAARFVYGIAVPQGLQRSAAANGGDVLDGVSYEFFSDPLNSTSFVPGDVSPPISYSYVEGPSAPASSYLQRRAGVPQGRVESLEVKSSVPGHARTVRVYVPAKSAASTERADLLLCFDGRTYETTFAVPTVLDNLIAQRLVPPVVAVFIDPPTGVSRTDELSPNPDLQKFLAQDLLPLLEARYHIRTDPASHAVAGSSLGGLAAAYTALEHPELFRGVISLSGSLWWAPHYQTNGQLAPEGGWLVKQYAQRLDHSLRVYMDVGTWESPAMVLSNRLWHSVLEGKKCHVVFDEFLGSHAPYNWRQKLPEAIISVLGTSASQPT